MLVQFTMAQMNRTEQNELLLLRYYNNRPDLNRGEQNTASHDTHTHTHWRAIHTDIIIIIINNKEQIAKETRCTKEVDNTIQNA